MNGDFWQAIGFVTVRADGPAFAIPLLRRPGGNSIVVQRTDANGRLADVDPLGDVPGQLISDVANGPRVQMGDKPLWAFRMKPGKHVLGSEDEVREWLRVHAHAPELQAVPLVRLSVVRFAGLDDELGPALRAAYAAMKAISDKAAEYWRSNVILGPKVRDRVAAYARGKPPHSRFEIQGEKAVVTLSAGHSPIASELASDRELATYLRAFHLDLVVPTISSKALRTGMPWIAVTAAHARSTRAMRYLERRSAGELVRLAAFNALVNGTGVDGLSRVYVFVDGTEGIDPSHLHRLRDALPTQCQVHLIWADYGAQLPGRRHIDAVHALTLLPAKTPWAGGDELDGQADLSTSERLAVFLKLADMRGHENAPLSVFVAAYRNDLLGGQHELANQLWVSAANSILPPWEANTLVYAGTEKDKPEVNPALGMLRMTSGFPLIPFNKGDVVAHLYEGWKPEPAPVLAVDGYMEAFRLMGWETLLLRGREGFMAESAATGRIQVLPLTGSFDRSNVRARIAELHERVFGRHVIIPTGPRPSADALASMCSAGLNVVLPHRLPLMADPMSEWAVLYPPLSQFNGTHLRRVLGSSLGGFLADRFPEVEGRKNALRLEVRRATKSAGGASIRADLNLISSSVGRNTTMTVHVSPLGPVVLNEHTSIETKD